MTPVALRTMLQADIPQAIAIVAAHSATDGRLAERYFGAYSPDARTDGRVGASVRAAVDPGLWQPPLASDELGLGGRATHQQDLDARQQALDVSDGARLPNHNCSVCLTLAFVPPKLKPCTHTLLASSSRANRASA